MLLFAERNASNRVSTSMLFSMKTIREKERLFLSRGRDTLENIVLNGTDVFLLPL